MLSYESDGNPVTSTSLEHCIMKGFFIWAFSKYTHIHLGGTRDAQNYTVKNRYNTLHGRGICSGVKEMNSKTYI